MPLFFLKLSKMSKILNHSDRKRIESIMIECKFLGLGSVEIQKQLLLKLAFKVSRPSIDKHIKEHLHGDLLSELIENTKKDAVLSVSENTPAENVPSFCEKTSEELTSYFETYSSYSDDFGEHYPADTMKSVYSDVLALIRGNINAHKLGKERLKAEYLKYLDSLRSMIKTARQSY